MKQIIDVNTGQVRLGGANEILRSTAIGSCIVVATYDAKTKTGALAHIMLPGKAPADESEKAKYAEDAIRRIIEQMTRAGAAKGSIQVCLVGAANVLKEKDDTVCTENIASVTACLRKNEIAVKATALGGTERKGLSLDIDTGCAFYTEGENSEQLLCEFGRMY